MRKFNAISIILVFILSVLVGCLKGGVLGINQTADIKLSGTTNIEDRITDEYKEWAALPKNEREQKVIPMMAKAPGKTIDSSAFGSKYMIDNNVEESAFDYREIIPENVINQKQEYKEVSWAYASLDSLETSLAIKNRKNNENTNKKYDFSEYFLDDISVYRENLNKYGVNREYHSQNSILNAMSKLTNTKGVLSNEIIQYGRGYIDFTYYNNLEKEGIVNDFLFFDKVDRNETPTNKLKNQMKSHLKKYSGIIANINGDMENGCINMVTGAINVNTNIYDPNQSVLIVGWDDNYDRNNFNSSCKPNGNGAWIVKSSWGTEEKWFRDEIVKFLKPLYPEEFTNVPVYDNYNHNFGREEDNLINSAIDSAVIKYNRDNPSDKFYLWEGINSGWYEKRIGDGGFFYVSYEDKLIYEQLIGIIDADDSVEDDIYQYNENGFGIYAYAEGTDRNNNKVYSNEIAQAVVFEKNPNKIELLDKVSLYGSAGDNYEVYVNAKNDNKNWSKLKKVEIEEEDASINYNGYHTIKLKNPIELTGSSFVIAINVKNNEEHEDNHKAAYALEVRDDNLLKYVQVENNKSFVTMKGDNNWIPTTSKINSTDNNEIIESADLTINAFVKEREDYARINSVTIEKTVYGDYVYSLDVDVVPSNDLKYLRRGWGFEDRGYRGWITLENNELLDETNVITRIDQYANINGYVHLIISIFGNDYTNEFKEKDNFGYLNFDDDPNNGIVLQSLKMKLRKDYINMNNINIGCDINGTTQIVPFNELNEILQNDIADENEKNEVLAYINEVREMFGNFESEDESNSDENIDDLDENKTTDNNTTDNTTENNTTTNNTIANNTTKNNTTTNNTTTNNTSNSNSDSKYKTVTGETDITVADKDIPQTGEKDFFVGFGSTFIIGIGLISFVNYKRIRIR